MRTFDGLDLIRSDALGLQFLIGFCLEALQQSLAMRDMLSRQRQLDAMLAHGSNISQPHPICREHPSKGIDRKSTRLNSSHVAISYAVFCLKKKSKKIIPSASTQVRPGTVAAKPPHRLVPAIS